jgi:hypothetical protein
MTDAVMEISVFTGLICFFFPRNVSPATKNLTYIVKVTDVLASQGLSVLKKY